MANEIALVVAQVASIPSSLGVEVFSYKATEAIAKGEAVYFLTSAGTIGVADANDSGKQQFRGIALEGVAAGQFVDVHKRGLIAGFTVSGMSYDDIAYLSDTAGDLSTTNGTLTVNCGRVVAMPDNPNLTKVLYIDADWLREWA